MLSRPESLEGLIPRDWPEGAPVVIDEVQRIPALLNEVHRLIESRRWHFLLIGSSARKLKRGQANLLAGRARQAELLPLTCQELTDFDLEKYLTWGGLPMVYQSNEPYEDLQAYVHTYLKEEVQAEAAVRRLASFSRFLELSAFANGQTLNFAALASDVGVSATTIREYYYLLEDTLMGFFLPCFTRSKRRKAVSTAKFYYFDVGVSHALRGLDALPAASDDFGRAFEHWIAMELRAYLSYKRSHASLSYWRTQTGVEVDFLIGEHLAVEVKAASHVQPKHLKGLRALAEEGIFKRLVLVSQDPISRHDDGIDVLPWQVFLEKLWDDQYFDF